MTRTHGHGPSVLLCAEVPTQPFGGREMRTWLAMSALHELGPLVVVAINPSTAGGGDPIAEVRRFGQEGELSADPGSAPIEARGPAGAMLSGALGTERVSTVVVDDVELVDELDPLVDPRVPVIHLSHNVETDLQARVRAEQGEAPNPRLRYAEARLVASADETWVCSALDAQRMGELHPRHGVLRVVPNAVDVSRYERRSITPTPPQPAARRIVFPATFDWLPNELAALELIDQVLPGVQTRMGDVQVALHLVGRDATEALRQAVRGRSDVMVTGAVPDIVPHLHQADVMVVPLRIGGGTRLKLLEAFSARLPVVSTAKGAEGIAVTSGRHLLIAEEPDDIAAAIATVLSEPDLAATLTDAAHRFVTAEHSAESTRALMVDAVMQLHRGRA